MMVSIKKNRKTMFVLGTAVLAIWGSIAHQVVEALGGGSEESGSEISDVPRGTPMREKYQYRDDVRDPFQFFPPARRGSARKSRPGTPLWIPPPIKLTGLVGSGKRKTAIVESPDGATFFLAEGDTMHGIKILKINMDMVTYLYKQKRAHWLLEGY